MMDAQSTTWRAGADKLLETLARENKYIVSDMLIIFLEAAGYGLADYSPLGGVFKRAAKRGIISRIDRPAKQALWLSKVYGKPCDTPALRQGQVVSFHNFGELDRGTYRIADIEGDCLRLEQVS